LIVENHPSLGVFVFRFKAVPVPYLHPVNILTERRISPVILANGSSTNRLLKNSLSLKEKVRERDKIRRKCLNFRTLTPAFSLQEKGQNAFSTAYYSAGGTDPSL
jgi:lipid A disaccharide synthetase